MEPGDQKGALSYPAPIAEPKRRKSYFSSFLARTEPRKSHWLFTTDPPSLLFSSIEVFFLCPACWTFMWLPWLHTPDCSSPLILKKVCVCWRNIWQSIYFRSTGGRKYGRKEKAEGAKENTVRSCNRQLSTNQLVVLVILHSNSMSGLITKPLPSYDVTFDNFPHCRSKAKSVVPTLCDPMDRSLPRSSIHRIFQARVLEWVAISFSRGSSWPRDRTQVSMLYHLSHQGSPIVSGM